MNCVICHKDGSIVQMIKDAIRQGNRVWGAESGLMDLNPDLYDFVWTEDEITPVIDETGRTRGYVEKAWDLNALQPPRSINQVTPCLNRRQQRELVNQMFDLADTNFQDAQAWVERNVSDPKLLTVLSKMIQCQLAIAKYIVFRLSRMEGGEDFPEVKDNER